MTIPHYGVWACQPTSYTAQTEKQDPKSPHIYLHFTDDTSSTKSLEAAINVKSIDKDSRLVFWVNRNFQHPVTETLSALDLGFHLASPPSDAAHQSDNSNSQGQGQNQKQHHNHNHNHGHGHGYGHSHGRSNRGQPVRRQQSTLQGLDFVRTQGLLNLSSGQVLPHDIPGPNNDILDHLDPILTDAINQKATGYIFGSSYGSGIHDVHMNQGSLPRFENGIYEDGALIFKFDDGHWEAVFLAFASQKVPTDDRGEALSDSKSLADILGQ
ncbi:Uncharacterized protein PECH_000683 [Penicillium ucsense]|uniref:Uncharacterized protein n=1 Tax=Penicillium ucsense TaxID=2839758 RepID=A0A8J8WJT9_9EURO|nr:Uncharacterized protein PECM_004966 [Penicillium ucsense]KAF7738408.1 Uncharacterized protein PECH_000683 [Penicillium ucsense]